VTVGLRSTVHKLRGAELAVGQLGDGTVERRYDFVRVSPNRALFGLIEVAERSKGNSIVPAAQATFRERASELFVGEEVNEADAMIELCLELNRSIINATGAVSSSPAFAACYNEDLGTICYVNAGHTPGLVRDSTGVSELGPTGLPLGLFSHVTCDARMVALQAGAALALVLGEAAFETRGKPNGSGFGAVQKSFQLSRMESADEICRALLSSVQSKGAPNNSNVATLVLLRHG
jgi:serine phosphatase RsbU (regulator of sigma subunit)